MNRIIEDEPTLQNDKADMKGLRWKYFVMPTDEKEMDALIAKARSYYFKREDVENLSLDKMPLESKEASSKGMMGIESPPYPGETPLTGWKEIARSAGWSERKAKSHREEMINRKVIYYEKKGTRKTVRAYPVDIKSFVKRLSQNR